MTVVPSPDPTAVENPTPGPIPQDVPVQTGGPGVFASVDTVTVVGGADASEGQPEQSEGDK